MSDSPKNKPKTQRKITAYHRNFQQKEKMIKIDLTNIPRCKVISIYSHKGGVGKTTVSLNFANEFFIKNNNQRILYIDLDPQMNLSYYLLGNITRINEIIKQKNKKQKNKEENSSNDEIETDVDDQIMKKFEEEIDKLDNINYNDFQIKKQLDILSKLRLFSEKHNNNDDLNYCYNIRKGVDLIFGNHRINEYTQEIDHEFVGKRCGIYTNAFKNMINHYRENYSLILIDLPPDLHNLNKIALLSSDYFICVLNPDVFAKITLKLIHKYFYVSSDIDHLKLNFKIPRYCGYILNKANYNNKDEIIVKHKKINEELNQLSKQLFDNGFLGSIRNYNPELHNELDKEFMFIDDSVLQNNKKQKESIKESYRIIINNYEDLIKNKNIKTNENE